MKVGLLISYFFRIFTYFVRAVIRIWKEEKDHPELQSGDLQFNNL